MSRYFRGDYSCKQDKDVETEIFINEGKDDEECVTVAFNRKTEWSHDSNYGADADGRRGEPRDFIDEDSAEDISVQRENSTEFVDLKSLPKDFQDKVEAEIEQWLSDNPPELELPEPEYERDDD